MKTRSFGPHNTNEGGSRRSGLLKRLRRYTRSAWLLHAWLMAGMILMPMSTGRGAWVEVDADQDGTVDFSYDDEVLSPGEIDWLFEDDDSDGLINGWEVALGYDPEDEDSDDDGWSDYDDYYGWIEDDGTYEDDPNDYDSDGDGLSDEEESSYGSDPYNPDTDEDGITDYDEVYITSTDPTTWDSDNDGFSDYDEWQGCYSVDYHVHGAGQSYYDWDGDGYYNYEDSDPLDESYGDGSGMDSGDSDGDGYTDDNDTHPDNPDLWEDSDDNGINDSDEDAYIDDYDWDGVSDEYDSHPEDDLLWNDFNDNGTNDEDEWVSEDDYDGDGYFNWEDSHLWDSGLYDDWDFDGINDSEQSGDDGGWEDPSSYDSDSDGYTDDNDSHPDDGSLWNDYDGDGVNDDEQETTEPDPEPDPSNWDWEDDDGDGWANIEDSHPDIDTRWTDWDDDGLNEEDESAAGSDPWNWDTDGDGLNDGEEVDYGTNPNAADSDQDGLTDYEETLGDFGSDPTDAFSLSRIAGFGAVYKDYYMIDLSDSDGDEIPDRIEDFYSPLLNPNNAADGAGDLDGDGITNRDEYFAGTDLRGNMVAYDMDRDGITDVVEQYWSSRYPGMFSTVEMEDAVRDDDGDGAFNFEEVLVLASDPGVDESLAPGSGWTDGHFAEWRHSVTTVAGTLAAQKAWADGDGDGLPDGFTAWVAAQFGTVPFPAPPACNEVDHDQDGMTNVWEYRYHLDLRSPVDAGHDEEPDGLSNLTEFRFGSHPRLKDTEAGGDQDDQDRFYGSNAVNVGQLSGLTSRFRAQMAADLAAGTTGSFSFSDLVGTQPEVPDPNPPIYQVRVVTRTHHTDGSPIEIDDSDWMDKASAVAYTDEEPEPYYDESLFEDFECTCEGGYLATDFESPIIFAGVIIGYEEYWVDDCSCEPPEPPEPEDQTWDVRTVRVRVYYNEEPDGAASHTWVAVSEEAGIIDQFSATTTKTQWNHSQGHQLIDPPLQSDEFFAPTGQSVTVMPYSPPNEPQGSGGISVADAAGPRYRKIGLNGGPLSDSKPQVQDESGEAPEETYVDAFTRHLTHSVSDVYVQAEGSQLPLMVRRDISHETFNLDGIRPWERPDTPFGMGWSSNICAPVKFETLGGSGNTLLAATVHDEQGSAQRYLGTGTGWVTSWEKKSDAESSFNTFSATVSGGPLKFSNIRLSKKFGTICDYEMTGITQVFSHDRIQGSDSSAMATYARLVQVTDRHGNRLRYEYADSMAGASDIQARGTLVPCRIYDPDRPGHEIQIRQSDGRIVEIRGPGGESITYTYDVADPYGAFRQAVESGMMVVSGGQVDVSDYQSFDYLGTVSRGGADVSYEYVVVDDFRISGGGTSYSGQTLSHLELAAITDELDRRYEFEYRLDHSVSETRILDGGEIPALRFGAPMLVTSIAGPHGVVEISGNRDVDVPANLFTLDAATSGEALAIPDYTPIDASLSSREVSADPIETVVTLPDDGGTYRYIFGQPRVYDPYIALDSLDAEVPLADEDVSNISMTLSYETLEITSALGVESYHFNPDAGMALASTTDLSGNTTNFYYSPTDVPPTIPAASLQGNAAPNGVFYDDPIVEVDALGGVKTFSYDETTRIMTGMTDVMGTRTEYTIAPPATVDGRAIQGLKVAETVRDSAGTVLRETRYRYDHPTFKGLVTSSWTISPDESVMPSSVSVTTLGDPNDGGANANPGWWREVTQTSGTVTATGELAEALTSSTTISDFNGNKRSVIDARGLITNFDYDARNRLISVTHPDDTTKTLDYDAHGNLISETNENDVTTFHEYDNLNRRIKTTIDLNGNGNADPNYTEITVNPTTGEPSYNGDITTSTTYNVRGQVATVTDPRGKVTTNTYDAGGRLIEVDDGGFITSYEYGANSGGGVFDTSGFKPTRITDPRGNFTTLVNDALYRTTSTTVTDGGTTTTTYDAAGHPLTITDPLDRVTTNTYDALGQVTQVTYPDDTTVHSYYTHHGQPWKVVNELAIETTTDFDALGRPIATHAPALDGETATSYTFYDEAGNAVATQDPLGRVVYTEYDLRNRPFRVTAPPVWDALAGEFAYPVTTTVYDALGQVVSVTDPLEATTTTYRDAAGRAYRVDDALGHATLSTYDTGGNALTVTNAEGHTVTNTYDLHGRLTQTEDGAGIVNKFAYDEAGNRTRVEDGLEQVTTFEYDALNRLTEQVFANDDTWTYTHNAVQKISQTDPKDVTTTYTYDQRDRLLTVTAPDLSRTMAYDDGGRLLSVTEAGNAKATVAYTYDDRGRVTSETSTGVTHSYAYDNAGNRISAAYGTGRTVTTSYDALNRPETIAEGGRLTRYGYDLAGRAVLLIAGNGQVSENEHDMAGRLVNRTLFRSLADRTEGGVLAEFGWSHDALGNVTAQHETWPGEPSCGSGLRTTSMTYDGANRLQTETIAEPGGKTTTTTYTYDAANNRSAKTVVVTGVSDLAAAGNGAWSYTFNAANQLNAWTKFDSNGGTQVKSATLTYDANGNRLTQTVTESVAGVSDPGQDAHNPNDLAPGTTSYAWDSQNRLLGVTMPDGSEHAYTYDYRTRRIGTHEQPSAFGSPPSAARHTTITFSGGLSIAEWETTSGPAPSALSSPPTVEYTRGPDMGGGVGGLLYTVRSTAPSSSPPSALGSTLRYNLSNGRGDIVAQSDPAAALTWTASYEAHGRRTTETGTNADKQRGNSKDEDPTGLLNEGFRYRDLETGVWLSRDPAGFVDGPNVYAYVKQNPWTAFDPEGLLALQTHNPHSWSNSRIRAITNSRAYQSAYWDEAGKGALAFVVAPVAVCAVHAGPFALLKEVGSEVVDQALEKATGVPVSATSVAGLLRDGFKKVAKEGSEVAIESARDSVVRTATELRKLPGKAVGGDTLPEVSGKWLRGTEGNAGVFPKQIADQMKNVEFKNFDEFRSTFWQLVAKDPELGTQFTKQNRDLMAKGKAPFAKSSQVTGRGRNNQVYNLHHKKAIEDGGGVYDLDNIEINSPRYHNGQHGK